MGMKKALETLAKQVPNKTKALTSGFSESVTTKNNVISTQDLRIDLHKDPKNENQAIAKVHANTQATDQGVKDFIKTGNKGSGSHSGTHKVIATIKIDQANFNAADLEQKILNAA
ncbi:MAG: hypothetical protein Q9175_007484 [Cornicularia normoerica]